MKNIVVPVDFSAGTEEVIEQALSLAKAFASTVYLLHVVLPNEDASSKEKKGMESEFATEFAALNDLARRFRDQAIDTHALLAEGVAPLAILEEAQRLDADLIVLGNRGHGLFTGALLGDVTQELVQAGDCPVLLVPIGSLPGR